MKTEREWDKILHIDTIGRDDADSDANRFPYEPTPYAVLERLAEAEHNKAGFPWKKQVQFHCCPAETYEITDTEVILRAVLGQIREACYRRNRKMRIFVYYPSDEFIAVLMTDPDIGFLDEIDCMDLFEGNNARERILVFEIG